MTTPAPASTDTGGPAFAGAVDGAADAAPPIDPPALAYAVGSPCAKRRYGCVGHVVERLCKYRRPDGALVDRLLLTCDRCDQAHGVRS